MTSKVNHRTCGPRMQVCKYNAKEAAAKGYQEAYKHARLLSARPKEATDKGSRRLLKHGRLLRARRVKPLRDLRRPPRHGRLPRTRFIRPLTTDPRRLLRRRRLPRTKPYRHFGVCQGGGRQTSQRQMEEV